LTQTAKQPGFLPRYGVTYFIIQQAAAIGGFIGGFIAMRSAPAKRVYARTKLATVQASINISFFFVISGKKQDNLSDLPS